MESPANGVLGFYCVSLEGKNIAIIRTALSMTPRRGLASFAFVGFAFLGFGFGTFTFALSLPVFFLSFLCRGML